MARQRMMRQILTWDERLVQQRLDPVFGYRKRLRPEDPLLLRSKPLLAAVLDELLAIIGSKSGENGVKEAPFPFLRRLDPVRRHVVDEIWQLRRLHPLSVQTQLWPEGHLEASHLALAVEALVVSQQGLHEC